MLCGTCSFRALVRSLLLALWAALSGLTFLVLRPEGDGFVARPLRDVAWSNPSMAMRLAGALLDAQRMAAEPEKAELLSLRTATAEQFPGGVHMLPSRRRGQLLQCLCRRFEVRRVLEVGTFTGFSAFCFAEAGAKVISLERSSSQASLARAATRTAACSVEVCVGDARHLVRTLGEEPLPTFDLLHLDADMKNYQYYLDTCRSYGLLSPNALVLADNVLFRGLVANASFEDRGRVGRIVRSLRSFNRKMLRDSPDTEGAILPEDDGLAVIWTRP
ncbi:mdmC [Symbiodinium natans]|uniref:MdmC protein n=1 Tax=Symbiodinium natans TaxID=878477 RepID=A0A812P3F8_9DINO|nr:mdmC [Symbiodinium natans]